jgi:nucleoside 2-deoxyribosyltransferase
MTAFISISYNHRKYLDKEIAVITDILKAHQIIPLVFVDTYKFELVHEREMMQQAMAEIDQCDLLIAEVSHKAIGIGIEVGYAKAKNKPIVYLRQKGAAYSTTIAGISEYKIVYKNSQDLKQQLNDTINQIIQH